MANFYGAVAAVVADPVVTVVVIFIIRPIRRYRSSRYFNAADTYGPFTPRP